MQNINEIRNLSTGFEHYLSSNLMKCPNGGRFRCFGIRTECTPKNGIF
jgi:hypothetical protein